MSSTPIEGDEGAGATPVAGSEAATADRRYAPAPDEPDQLCRCPVHCAPGTARSFAAATARLQAARYAATLTDGEDIDGDVGGTDEAYIAAFRDYLPAALVAAGFTVHARLEGGRVITTVQRREPA